MNLTVKKIHFRDHNGELKDKIESQRVLLLVDGQDVERGEPRKLQYIRAQIWRSASKHL